MIVYEMWRRGRVKRVGGVEGYRESGYERERRCHSTLSLVVRDVCR